MMEVREEARWRAQEAEHVATVEQLTEGHLQRRRTGRTHPVEDFLFVYYRHRPGQMRRWHPGPEVLLRGDDPAGRGSWPYYAATSEGTHLDLEAFLAARGDAVRTIHDLLTATAARPAQFSCFGLHEWAMVYRLEDGARRHESLPLRLSRQQTDAVVESLPIRCTHADAFRFFTPAARPLNSESPDRATQIDHEQPGCVHATMDLYKWATKLGPAVPGSLLVDAFVLARRARELDMRASPYDVSALGHEPVAVETPQGRATYVAAQRDLAAEGAHIRDRLLGVTGSLMAYDVRMNT